MSRAFARILSLTLLSLTIFSTAWASKPNIVFILLDDLDATTTKPFYREAMPHTMALMDQAVEFKNAFVTTPLCCPSRASILSGMYGHNTNVLGNGGPRGGWGQFRDNEPYAFPNLLKAQGYRTAMLGKYLNGYNTYEKRGKWIMPPLPVGFTDGAVMVSKNLKKYKGYNYHLFNWKEGQTSGSLEWRGEKEADYSTDVVRDKTLAFIDDAKAQPERPFFAYVNPTCPHFPLQPAPRHQKIADERWGYKSFPINRPNVPSEINDVEAYLADKPKFLQKTYDKRIDLFSGGGKFLEWMGARLPSDAPAKNIGAHQVDWHNRMGSLLACDEMIRDIVARLKVNGQWDNTLLIFTSDNGYNLGAHGLNQKLSPYEEAIRVPSYILAGPKVGLATTPRSLDHWVLNIDFAPTLMEMVTGRVPDNMDGKSFLPLLGDKLPPANNWRRQFVIEYAGPGLANGYLTSFERLHYRFMPAYLMDVPDFTALRFMDQNNDSWVYTSWQHFPAIGPKAKSKRDEELYHLNSDRFQLHNLFRQKSNADIAPLKDAMTALEKCKGQTGPDRCNR